MKNYLLLCVLVCSAFSLAMDDSEENYAKKYDWETASVVVIPHECSDRCVEYVHHMIDASLLHVDTHSWFRSVKGTYESLWDYALHSGDMQRAIERLKEICSYVPEACQNDSHFEQLQQSHRHAAHLLDTVINHRVTQLKQVVGSTIDDVLNVDENIPGLSAQMSGFIYRSVHKRYVQEMQLDKPLTEIVFDSAEKEIHFVSLDAWYADVVCNISIVDGKYVRGMTSFGKQIAWDIKEGTELGTYVNDFFEEPQFLENQYVATND